MHNANRNVNLEKGLNSLVSESVCWWVRTIIPHKLNSWCHFAKKKHFAGRETADYNCAPCRVPWRVSVQYFCLLLMKPSWNYYNICLRYRVIRVIQIWQCLHVVGWHSFLVPKIMTKIHFTVRLPSHDTYLNPYQLLIIRVNSYSNIKLGMVCLQN